MDALATTLPQDWFALCLLVLTLGMKHGFDADHLATIDGLTRFNLQQRPGMARYCGVLFSLGHGAVVVAIALLVSTLAQHWQVPQWFEWLGAIISILFLAGLGVVNLRAVWQAAPHEIVRPVGFKGRWLGRLQHTAQPVLVAAVGALFALSFDTLSQAALFALAATHFGGWQQALVLGLLFMLGMLMTDGINGLWISRLIRRADQMARLASRLMGLVVGSLSLLVALFGLCKLTLPGVATWSEGKESVFGLTVIAVVLGSFLLARWLTLRPVAAVAVPPLPDSATS